MCRTCGFSEGQGCCEDCAITCHLGLDNINRGKIRSYSDCGAGELRRCVTCLKMPNPNYQTPQ